MTTSTAPRRDAAAEPMRDLNVLGFRGTQGLALLGLVVLIVACPFFLYPVFLMKVLCFALFASAFNLLLGYVGLLSFGHAAFFGAGGYVSAWTAKNLGVTPEISILLGGLTGAALGLVIGWLAIRRQGLTFAMITLALGQLVYFVCLEIPYTGGEDGIQQVPRGKLLGVLDLNPDRTMYWVVAAIFLIFFWLLHRIVHSPFGQVLKAIRENEPRAVSLGYRTDDYKLMAFVLSTFVTGIAGGTKAIVFGIATLTDVHNAMSGEVILMTLLGGMGTIFGPGLGATIVTAMEQYLAPFGAWVTVIEGLFFMACVLAFRRGIVGSFNATNFLSAVKSCFAQYATFGGRARRSEYWYFVLFSSVMGLLAVVLVTASAETPYVSSVSAVFAGVAGLALFLPSLAVTVRRLHDIGRSGWWMLIQVIPAVGPILLLIWMCMPGDDGPNRFGPPPIAPMRPGRAGAVA